MITYLCHEPIAAFNDKDPWYYTTWTGTIVILPEGQVSVILFETKFQLIRRRKSMSVQTVILRLYRNTPVRPDLRRHSNKSFQQFGPYRCDFAVMSP